MHARDAVAQALRSRANLLFLILVLVASAVLFNPLPLVLAAVVELVVLPAVVQARTARRTGRRRD